MRYKAIIVYSEFAKRMIDPSVGKYAMVIYPPIDPLAFTPKKKTKTILSVGRFSNFFQAKKQEVLIDAFRRALTQGVFAGWQLILAGGLLPSDESYFARLQKSSESLPISLMPNLSFQRLVSLYEKATIYWHAAGFGEVKPEHMEHFGITTVEAMAAGCIPLVFDGGGQREIIRNEVDGFLWENTEELIRKTLSVTNDTSRMEQMSQSSRTRAHKFSQSRFYKTFDDLLCTIQQ
jgi:glycosyltransferase involved in cell wall biosynthesis